MLLLIAAGASGCQTMKKQVTYVPPPPPQNYFHPATEGPAIRRVAMLPFYYDQRGVATLVDIENAFQAELTKTSLFEVVRLNRQELEAIAGRPQLSSTELLPADLLAELGGRYGVDGVLFTDVTSYFPYRPVSIGVRTKLVDVRSGEIRWAFDYLFDSGNPAIAKTAETFHLRNRNEGFPIANAGTVLQSPSRFARYAANATYTSLVTH